MTRRYTFSHVITRDLALSITVHVCRKDYSASHTVDAKLTVSTSFLAASVSRRMTVRTRASAFACKMGESVTPTSAKAAGKKTWLSHPIGFRSYYNQQNIPYMESIKDQKLPLCKNVQLTMNHRTRFVFTAKSTLCNQIVGLFTGERIKSGKFIMEYTGKVVVEDSLKEQMD